MPHPPSLQISSAAAPADQPPLRGLRHVINIDPGKLASCNMPSTQELAALDAYLAAFPATEYALRHRGDIYSFDFLRALPHLRNLWLDVPQKELDCDSLDRLDANLFELTFAKDFGAPGARLVARSPQLNTLRLLWGAGSSVLSALPEAVAQLPAGQHSAVRELALNGSGAIDPAWLHALPQLRLVRLRSSGDASFLPFLPGLRGLALEACRLAPTSAPIALPHLEVLRVMSNGLPTDVIDFAALTGVRRLEVAGVDRAHDWAALAQIPCVEELVVEFGRGATVEPVAAFRGHPTLRSVRTNDGTDAEVAAVLGWPSP